MEQEPKDKTVFLTELTHSEAMAFYAIRDELRKAKEKHPQFVKTIPEMCLVLTEETGEVAQAILKHDYEDGEFVEIGKELIQVGAVVVRFLSKV